MLQLPIAFIVMIIFVSDDALGATNLTVFQQEALVQHNFRRQQHCVPAMSLNASLNTIAQNYAVFLANNNLFNHSYYSGVGENMWAIWSSAPLGSINGSRAVESWYSEIADYNFSAPGYAWNTGHFTQLVWQTSIQLGVGIAYNGNMTRAVVVANYFPQGNIIGSFGTRVPPVCTTTTTATTARSSAISTIPLLILNFATVSMFICRYNTYSAY